VLLPAKARKGSKTSLTIKFQHLIRLNLLPKAKDKLAKANLQNQINRQTGAVAKTTFPPAIL
jgi:hypothetical protein